MSRSFFILLLIPAGLAAQDLKPVSLPAPKTNGGKPLMDALRERQSTREFIPGKLSSQALSNLLWAAWGINREDGRRTAPSASNRQEIELYVVTAEGAFIYDAKANALKPVVSGDLRKTTGTAAFVGEAPLNLVYVADFSKMGGSDENAKNATANADTGFIAQNVYLFCASEGLGAVVRGSVPRAELSKALNLRPEQRVTLAQTVGYIRK
ncbi:MAG: SagB/ThcOx family dehydrogenase [Acidobacteriia bacterium]|nr:SagB/ThcOx family dehydrogenase [Terriglobia bacterium]